MMGVNTRNMYSCLQKYNKLNKSHLVKQLLNSIHDARTHVYKIRFICVVSWSNRLVKERAVQQRKSVRLEYRYIHKSRFAEHNGMKYETVYKAGACLAKTAIPVSCPQVPDFEIIEF